MDERIETTPKGGVSKRVPGTPRLLAALRTLHETRTGATVLAAENGQTWTPKVLRRAVARVERAVGLDDTGKLHVLLHSFASNRCAAGAHPLVVQRLGRWAELRVMQRYAHLHEGALREASISSPSMATPPRAAPRSRDKPLTSPPSFSVVCSRSL